MQRFHQIVFVVSILAICWLLMMAVHELGHVVGAWLSGGRVERVVLHPLTISRTDVSPNPNPLLVVWLGPLLGCLFPLVLWGLVPKRYVTLRMALLFFLGFCLLANGAYIALGSFDRVGDCRVMLQNGSPLWLLLLFGTIAVPAGLFAWHRLGSLKSFLMDSSLVDARLAYTTLGLLVLVVLLECVISPR